MIDLVDTAPRVDVEPAEFIRLLGYPPGRVLRGRAAELAAQARLWYSVHGRPWVMLRGTDRLDTGEAGISIEGTSFTPSRLTRLLAEARAHGVVLAAVSAGEELDEEAQRLWKEEKPDEYFFLETFGSAVVEHLAMATGARLCAWAEAQGMAVLPHDSPGYTGWDIGEQARLLPLVGGTRTLPGPLRVIESGALVPRKSLLAVYGVTRQADARGRLTSLVPCEQCSLPRCQYRRRPYRLAGVALDDPIGVEDGRPDGRDGVPDGEEARDPVAPGLVAPGLVAPGLVAPGLQPRRPPLRIDARYCTNAKALQRWARERLTLTPRDDRGLDARFRYDGTTCTNMGRELRFLYEVTLGPRDDGYPIREQRCGPAPGDAGYTSMCGYIRNADGLMAAIAGERPLAGQRLDDVLSWARPTSSAGCYCDASSREHKWGLVLETIHFALSQREREEG